MDTRVAARFGTRAAQPPACRNRQWHREQARRRRDGRRWPGATAPDRAGDRRQAPQVGMPRGGSGGRVSWPPLSGASSGPGSAGPQDRTLSPGRPNGPAHAFRTLRGRPRDPVPCVPPGQPGGPSRRIAWAVRSEFTRIPLSVDPSSRPGRGRGSSTIRRPRGGVPPPHPRRASASARWPDRPHGSRGRPAPPRW